MRKYYICIGIVLLVVLCLLLIMVYRNDYEYTNINMEMNNELNVELIVDIKEKVAELHISNQDEVDLFFGLQYWLEVWKNNKWEEVSGSKVWYAAEIYLMPGKEYVQKIMIKEMGLKSGRAYRIRKEINEYECYSDVFIVE